jgi:hypothetical protein
MGTYNLTPEERERRRQLAKSLVAQGKLGGRQPGAGRPRKKRAAEVVAEEAQKEASKIVKAFQAALDPSQPAQIRLQAAKDWLAVEHKESVLQLQEDRDLQKLERDELVERVVTTFMRFADAGVLDSAIVNRLGPDVIDLNDDGDVIEDDGADQPR